MSTLLTPAAAEDIRLHYDERYYIRMGWLLVSIGFLGFLLWAAFAPLDKGVSVPGTVTVSGNRKTIQHPSGGIVDAILVREGDTVEAGQVLLRMNETQARADAESLRIQHWTALATQARLVAERDGSRDITFPQEVISADQPPAVRAALQAQRELFTARREVLRNELARMRELASGYQAQIASLRLAKQSQEVQRNVLGDQLTNIRGLAREGFVARTHLFDLERLYAQSEATVSENAGRTSQLQSQLSELQLRIDTRLQDEQKQIRSDLADTQLQVESLRHQLQAAEFALENASVKSPVRGSVVGLSVFTPGGYIAAGKPLMDIVPNAESLQVEGQLPVHLIDTVHPGLHVELMFTAFNQNWTPRVDALLEQVSADRLTDEQTGVPYYRIQARVTNEGMRCLAGLQLRPGMPVQAFIKTGERSLLSYLFKPLMDRTQGALTEE